MRPRVIKSDRHSSKINKVRTADSHDFAPKMHHLQLSMIFAFSLCVQFQDVHWSGFCLRNCNLQGGSNPNSSSRVLVGYLENVFFTRGNSDDFVGFMFFPQLIFADYMNTICDFFVLTVFLQLFPVNSDQFWSC